MTNRSWKSGEIGLGGNPVISFPASRCSLPRQHITKIRTSFRRFLINGAACLHTQYHQGMLRVGTGMAGQDRRRSQHGKVSSLATSRLHRDALLRAAWIWSLPKQSPFPHHLTELICSCRLTAAAVFCLQANTQQC